MENKIIIDGKNAILGRLASFAAKQAMLGKRVIVVNCKEVVITGKPRSVINQYKKARELGGASLQGPFFPKFPERIVKRTIRGMLAHKKLRGKTSLKRIRCYNEIPAEFENVKKLVAGKEKKIKTIKLGELSKEI